MPDTLYENIGLQIIQNVIKKFQEYKFLKYWSMLIKSTISLSYENQTSS